MMLTTSASTVCFAAAAALYLAVREADLLQLGQPWFWLLVAVTPHARLTHFCALSRGFTTCSVAARLW